MTTTTTPTLDIVREHVGRRSRITRDEMTAILQSLADDGLDLRNDCVSDTWEWDEGGRARPDQTPAQITRAALGWTRACRDITVISILPSGCVPHGQVRYDQPGTMAPGQRATVMFVAERLGDYEYDQIGQMRHKADRVLIVQGEPEPEVAPAPPAPAPMRVSCDEGHTWEPIDGDDQRWERGYARCPTCGEGWV